MAAFIPYGVLAVRTPLLGFKVGIHEMRSIEVGTHACQFRSTGIIGPILTCERWTFEMAGLALRSQTLVPTRTLKAGKDRLSQHPWELLGRCSRVAVGGVWGVSQEVGRDVCCDDSAGCTGLRC